VPIAASTVTPTGMSSQIAHATGSEVTGGTPFAVGATRAPPGTVSAAGSSLLPWEA
jgi:hypothetical protein